MIMIQYEHNDLITKVYLYYIYMYMRNNLKRRWIY